MKRWDGPSRWLEPAEHDIPSKTHRDSSQFEANREAGRAKNEGKRSGNTPDFLHFVQYLLYYSGFCLTDLPVHPAYLLIMLLSPISSVVSDGSNGIELTIMSRITNR